MANENPVVIDEKPKPVEFIIPKDYDHTSIYLTLKVELMGKGWKYAASHIIFLKNSDLYPALSPEPEGLKIDYAKNLAGKKLKIKSHVSRFNFQDKENTKPPKVQYTLLIKAGDDLIGEFTARSGSQNPVNFNSAIVFKSEE